MLGLIGIRKNVDINIRERLAIALSKQSKAVKELNKLYEEVVIISTCNRTEIYISGCLESEEDIRKIFEVLDWDISLLEYTFYLEGISVAKHLLEVVCGFHSKILGEDQILGQVKLAYELSLENKAINTKLLRLFEEAISCGKRFRTESKLYEIPVSASSIAVNEAESFGAESVMVLGYGTIGSLVVKYILGNNIDNLSDNTVIYGHGRLDKTVFGSLKNALNKSWQNNKDNYIIWLSTEKENMMFQIFSIYTIEKESYYIETNFKTTKDKETWLNTMKERNKGIKTTDVSSTDKILTLSTCENAYGGRIVVHAKLIKRQIKS